MSIEHGSPGINGLTSTIEIVPQHLNISRSTVEYPITTSISLEHIPNINTMSLEQPASAISSGAISKRLIYSPKICFFLA